MKRLRFAGLDIVWDPRDLPLDPFALALPLPLDAEASSCGAAIDADLTISTTTIDAPARSPADRGAQPVLFHATTQCFALDGELVLWDGASKLTVAADGREIRVEVHASSIVDSFRFSSVTVTMALLLALRSHGLFHLHAAAASWPGGSTWLMPGESGAGKSTLSLSLFAAGAQWLGDDSVLLRAVGTEIEVVGWARALHVTPRTAAEYPALRPLLFPRLPPGAAPLPGGEPKWALDPRRAFPGRGRTSAKGPFVLAFPTVSETARTHVASLPRAEALGRLYRSCTWVASRAHPRREEQLGVLARLADSSRAFEVVLGADWLSDPDAALARLRRRLDVTVVS